MKLTEYYFLTQLFPRVGPRTVIKLLEEWSSIDAVFEQLQKKHRLNQNQIKQHLSAINEGIQRHQLSVIFWHDDEYPQAFRNLSDPPLFFFYKGTLPQLRERTVAIVGTRNPSAYGQTITQKITAQLVNQGVVIASGFMRGIDTQAHRTVLDHEGRTIGVLGSGFNYIVPPENKKLVNEVIKKGALISEFIPDQQPTKYTFPQRNRLVAALSEVVIVIEAGPKSGALITARLAGEQGKTVAAVPGSIFSVKSAGANWLIGQGATVISTIDGVGELLGFSTGNPSKEQPVFVNKIQKNIFERLSQNPASCDDLVRSLQVSTQVILSEISIMELTGLVKKFDENSYMVD
ncbi:DNA-processing protein DprA [candidate division WWE3 bacterium]|uniref:DNA-processing protein DprA n=1 Tax=candidate division WWE3 bacterium TaxID=2053526 RepID=A0A955LH90_UNCKA|nr:DNA-processing protein DprA [candidate division WWE3 bacterium]